MANATQEKLVRFLQERGADRAPIPITREDLRSAGMPPWWLRGASGYLREAEKRGLVRLTQQNNGTYVLQLVSTRPTSGGRSTARQIGTMQFPATIGGVATVQFPLTVRVEIGPGPSGLPEREIRPGVRATKRRRNR